MLNDNVTDTMEIIRLNNMIFYAHHGYYQAERELGQKFEVDVEMECNLSRAIETDNLKDTVNYREVYQQISQIFNNTKFTLVETLAERIAQHVLERFAIQSIRIKVRKPQVSMNGFLDNVEVEIFRTK